MDNQFIYRRKFPDPKIIFNRSKVEIDDLFENAIFLLDANVLLAPFQIGKDNLEKIHKVYSHLNKENRIFIPEHALLEFYNNRSLKISDLFTVIDKYLSELPSIKEFNYPILEQLTAYSEILVYRSEISDSVKKYKDALNRLKEGVTNWNWSDPVTMMYKAVFSDNNIISLEEDEKSLFEEFEKRILNEIPPGNKDSWKAKNAIGDFLIWKSILKIGKKQKRNVVFVSNDEKNDWILKGNKKSISTRFELIDEFFRETEGFNFLSVTYDNFLKRQGLIVEEIENKRNIGTNNIEIILQKLNHSFLLLLNEMNNNEEYPHIDSDILDPEIHEFNDILNQIKDTLSFSDEIHLFNMKEILEKISKLNYIICFENHRMKHSTSTEEVELRNYLLKFIEAYNQFTLDKYF